jgi:hypothetical protein
MADKIDESVVGKKYKPGINSMDYGRGIRIIVLDTCTVHGRREYEVKELSGPMKGEHYTVSESELFYYYEEVKVKENGKKKDSV